MYYNRATAKATKPKVILFLLCHKDIFRKLNLAQVRISEHQNLNHAQQRLKSASTSRKHRRDNKLSIALEIISSDIGAKYIAPGACGMPAMSPGVAICCCSFGNLVLPGVPELHAAAASNISDGLQVAAVGTCGCPGIAQRWPVQCKFLLSLPPPSVAVLKFVRKQK